MKNYIKKWNFMRALRLAIGVYVIINGVQTAEWLFVFFGITFSAMALLNIGCCGVGGCQVEPEKNSKKENEVIYEEVL